MAGEQMGAVDARRRALGAQGFGAKTSATKAGPSIAALRKAARKLRILQMDPINVLVRSHYLPTYSRLGPYDLSRLDALAYEKREVFEYVGHEWSLVDTDLHPALRWRMKAFADDARWMHNIPPSYPRKVIREIEKHGPLTSSGLSDPGVRGADRFQASPGKRTLHWLTQGGRLTVSSRQGLQQVYDLTERVIPGEVLDRPTPDRDDARRQLLLASARALGVATARDIVSYFFLGMGVAGTSERATYGKVTTAAKLVSELAADGQLQEVDVEGWDKPGYLHPDAEAAKPVTGCSFLSPFDSLIWERERTERLFGFRYRIEIYTPPAKREFGYYVLPLLLDEALVGRMDLKADRKAGRLQVLGAYCEKGVSASSIAEPAASEVARFAGWLKLDGVEVGSRGNLSKHLRAERAW